MNKEAQKIVNRFYNQIIDNIALSVVMKPLFNYDMSGKKIKIYNNTKIEFKGFDPIKANE